MDNKEEAHKPKGFSIPWIHSLIKEAEEWIQLRSRQSINYNLELFPTKVKKKEQK